MQYQMEKFIITYYVPESHLNITKEALFKTGAGFFGLYDKACWQTKGTGQYRTLEGANPFHGKVDELCVIEEFKVEVLCEKQYLKLTIDALIDAHPYETPVYSVIQCFNP